MLPLKLLFPAIFILFSMQLQAQSKWTYEDVNNRSFSLYEKASWSELLDYGKLAVSNGQDFVLLRLRMGYASFMLNNFSEAVKHYEAVIKNDSYNSAARYYIWLCRKYLNQGELASGQLTYFSKEALEKEALKKVAITAAGFEASFKSTDIALRGNTFYGKVNVQNRFGWNVHMDQAVAFFWQKIQFPRTVGGFPPRPQVVTININQKEYYNKLTANIGNHLQLKGAYHYTYTPVGTSVFNNHTGLAGIKYYGNYFDVQANAIFSTISDSSISQFELQLGVYPLGNMKLYGFSTAIFRKRPSGSAFNFRQILGGQVTPKLWLEANATFGSFSDLLENDALYIYNTIDKNLFKGGLIAYYQLATKCVFQLGYTFEQRQVFKQSITFNQHSITGGLSWKF